MFFENRMMSAPDVSLVESPFKKKYSRQIQDELHLRHAVKEANSKICANRSETKRQSKDFYRKFKKVNSEAERRELIGTAKEKLFGRLTKLRPAIALSDHGYTPDECDKILESHAKLLVAIASNEPEDKTTPGRRAKTPRTASSSDNTDVDFWAQYAAFCEK